MFIQTAYSDRQPNHHRRQQFRPLDPFAAQRHYQPFRTFVEYQTTNSVDNRWRPPSSGFREWDSGKVGGERQWRRKGRSEGLSEYSDLCRSSRDESDLKRKRDRSQSRERSRDREKSKRTRKHRQSSRSRSRRRSRSRTRRQDWDLRADKSNTDELPRPSPTKGTPRSRPTVEGNGSQLEPGELPVAPRAMVAAFNLPHRRDSPSPKRPRQQSGKQPDRFFDALPPPTPKPYYSPHTPGASPRGRSSHQHIRDTKATTSERSHNSSSQAGTYSNYPSRSRSLSVSPPRLTENPPHLYRPARKKSRTPTPSHSNKSSHSMGSRRSSRSNSRPRARSPPRLSRLESQKSSRRPSLSHRGSSRSQSRGRQKKISPTRSPDRSWRHDKVVDDPYDTGDGKDGSVDKGTPGVDAGELSSRLEMVKGREETNGAATLATPDRTKSREGSTSSRELEEEGLNKDMGVKDLLKDRGSVVNSFVSKSFVLSLIVAFKNGI